MKAILKGTRISTRKIRHVADSIRNMKASAAIDALPFVDKRGSKIIAKVIKSAVANAMNLGKVTSIDDLFIDKLLVTEGAFIKRFRPSTRGRVHPYKKRSTHITVILKEKQQPKIEMKEKEEVKANG